MIQLASHALRSPQVRSVIDGWQQTGSASVTLANLVTDYAPRQAASNPA